MTYVLARRQSNMTMLHNATNIITMPAENTYIIEKKTFGVYLTIQLNGL